MTLKRLARILKTEFTNFPHTGFPEGFMSVEYNPGHGATGRGENLNVKIGNRNVSLNSRGSVVGAGTELVGGFRVTHRRT